MKAVLFDLDDTLSDHTYSVDSGIQALTERWGELRRHDRLHLRTKYGQALDAVHARFIAGEINQDEKRIMMWRTFLDSLGLVLSDDEREEARQISRGAYRAARRPVPGAIPLLTELRGRGITIGIVTNNAVEEQMTKLAELGLTSLIDILAISEEVGAIKPDPRIFHEALRRAGVAAADAVMVGDSWENDVQGAMAAGITPVWFSRWGVPNPDNKVQIISSFEPMVNVVDVLLRS